MATNQPDIKGDFTVSVKDDCLNIAGEIVIDGSIHSDDVEGIIRQIAEQNGFTLEDFNGVNIEKITVTGEMTIESTSKASVNMERINLRAPH